MHADIVIRGGTVVDPSRGDAHEDEIVIAGGRIASAADCELSPETDVIDATGCIVTPGLIDHHAHVFHGGSVHGLDADVSLLPMGITTVLDAGSTGVDAAESFIKGVALQSRMRILSLLNVSSEGLTTSLHTEDLDPTKFDKGRLKEFFARYPETVKGLKIRCGAEMVGALGLRPLAKAVELADELRCNLTVHITNPPCDPGDLVELLRAGDVACHVYHGLGYTILDGDGRVKPKIRAARERGVLFDTADGQKNHSQAVAQRAIADGFLPDIISTDLVKSGLFRDISFGLPLTMSRYMAHGISLLEVVRACTATPARVLGLGDGAGTLAPGAVADVAIFAVDLSGRSLTNALGETMTLPQMLLPQMTIREGDIVFRQLSF
ncbi:MAG: amidohydrolase family protein [Rhizobiaceae bacterium]|nr:amidohydrolase family protein [Rhizobiaceae bacterium]